MTIISWIIFGLIVGAIAKFLVPGKDGSGWVATIVLGILGSFVGGYLANLLFNGNGNVNAAGPAGWLGSIIGPIVLLLIYRSFVGRRTGPPPSSTLPPLHPGAPAPRPRSGIRQRLQPVSLERRIRVAARQPPLVFS